MVKLKLLMKSFLKVKTEYIVVDSQYLLIYQIFYLYDIGL